MTVLVLVLVLLLLVLTMVVEMMSTASEMMARMWSWKWKRPDIISTCLWQNSVMIIHANNVISQKQITM